MPQVAVSLTDDELFELLKKSRAGSAIGAVREAIATYLAGKGKVNKVIVAEDTEKLAQEIVKHLTKVVSEEGTQKLRTKVSNLEDNLKTIKKEIKELQKAIKDLEDKLKEIDRTVEVDDATIRKVVREIFEERERIIEDFIRKELKAFRKDIDNYQFKSLHQLKKEVDELKIIIANLSESAVNSASQTKIDCNKQKLLDFLSLQELTNDNYKGVRDVYHLILAIKLTVFEELCEANVFANILHAQPDKVVFRLIIKGLEINSSIFKGATVIVDKEALEEKVNQKFQELSGSDSKVVIKPIAGEDYLAEIEG